jgi:hypothetical protein
VENGTQPWRPLGQMLVERGLIQPEQLEVALRAHAQTGEPIGSVLVGLDFVAEATLRNVLLEQCGLDLTRQEGFGSGLLSQLERRGVGVRPAAPEQRAVAPKPVEEPQRKRSVLRRRRDTVGASFDALLEMFEERSKALSAELAAMRRLLHEIAG